MISEDAVLNFRVNYRNRCFVSFVWKIRNTCKNSDNLSDYPCQTHTVQSLCYWATKLSFKLTPALKLSRELMFMSDCIHTFSHSHLHLSFNPASNIHTSNMKHPQTCENVVAHTYTLSLHLHTHTHTHTTQMNHYRGVSISIRYGYLHGVLLQMYTTQVCGGRWW